MNNLFKPTYLKELCEEFRLNPSKKYGQNFLINPKPIEKMIEAGDIKKTDTIIEVGPGFGVLTFELAKHAKKVMAFEIEKKLEKYWEENKKKNIEIIWGNVLTQVESRKSKVHKVYSSKREIKSFKVIANLPYQITSGILRRFLEMKSRPEKMILMVQREVADRICAKPGGMSILAVSVQYYAEVKKILNVPNTYFWPSPKVNSAVIELDIKDKKFDPEFDKKFFEVVRLGFSSKRKMLIKNLKPLLIKCEHTNEHTNLEEVFDKLKLNKKVRAQELSIEEWQTLSTLLFL